MSSDLYKVLKWFMAVQVGAAAFTPYWLRHCCL